MVQKEQSQTTDWMERPVFRDHQRLTPERLNRMHENHATRMRHALLGLAGPGVIYGYAIETDDERKCKMKNGSIYISCGLAIDCHGRQLYWPGGWIDVNDLGGEKPKCDGRYTLWVHYAERKASGYGHNDCNGDEADWIGEGVVFTLTQECKPVTQQCPDHCGECISPTDYVCGRLGGDEVVIPPDEYLHKLCEHPGKLCVVGCDDWLYDPDAGLPLACVAICDLTGGRMDCDPEYGFCPDEPYVCDNRPYVYRNPLLYELIRGCHTDLACVEKLSFEDWLTHGWDNPLPWDVFATGIKGGMNVWFSKPIEKKTLHRTSVFVTAIVQEYATLFQDCLRLPVQAMPMLDANDDFARGVRLEFHSRWLDRQVDDEPSRFASGAIIEFTVRGAMLRDKCGCMLDARPLGFPKHKPGQAMPGDDFVVTFCVAPRPPAEQKGGNESYASDALQQSE